MQQSPTRFILLVLLLGATCCSAKDKPKLASDPLGADEQAIYKLFLAGYANGSGQAVNLANRTELFRGDDASSQSCMKDFGYASSPTDLLHTLSESLLPNSGYRLVDPDKQCKKVKENDPGPAIKNGKDVGSAVTSGFAAGLLSLSEIRFSNDRKYGALFAFVCGSLCGSGGTLIYKPDDDGWKPGKGKQRGQWIARSQPASSEMFR